MTEPELQFDTGSDLVAKILDLTSRGLMITIDSSIDGKLCVHLQTKAEDPTKVAHARQFLDVKDLPMLPERVRQRRLLYAISDLDRILARDTFM